MNIKRKSFKPISFVLAILAAVAISCNTTNPPTATSGLIVSTVTSGTGGSYAPKNVVAIWIENSSGTFVKSLTVYAAERKYDLTNWGSSSNENTTDAVTGATRSGFGTIYGIWDGTDVKGAVVADGTYNVCMELTDKSTTGNFSTFSFTKGATAQTLTPANVPSFSNISIKWMPL